MEKLDEETIEAAIARATARGRELATQPAELRLLVRCIDLTTLAGDDTRARVEALALRAAQPSPNDAKLSTAAVCVYPARVADVVRALNGISSSHKVRVAAGKYYKAILNEYYFLVDHFCFSVVSARNWVRASKQTGTIRK